MCVRLTWSRERRGYLCCSRASACCASWHPLGLRLIARLGITWPEPFAANGLWMRDDWLTLLHGDEGFVTPGDCRQVLPATAVHLVLPAPGDGDRGVEGAARLGCRRPTIGVLDRVIAGLQREIRRGSLPAIAEVPGIAQGDRAYVDRRRLVGEVPASAGE